MGHTQRTCSTDISNHFAEGSGVQGAQQSPGLGKNLLWRLLTQLGWWQGDAVIRGHRHWHLSAGRRGEEMPFTRTLREDMESQG